MNGICNALPPRRCSALATPGAPYHAGGLLSAGLAVSMLANRVRVPGLVLVLGLGMAVGSDGLGWISFGDYRLPTV